MSLLLLWFILFFCTWVLFCTIIFPLWNVIYCARAAHHSAQAKVIWVLLMIVFWPLAAFVYALTASRRALFRWISLGIFLGVVVLGVGFFKIFSWLIDFERNEISQYLSRLPTMSVSEISQDEMKHLEDSLKTVHNELDEANSSDVSRVALMNLIELFDRYAQDGIISRQEYDSWKDRFAQREKESQQGVPLEEFLQNFRHNKKTTFL